MEEEEEHVLVQEMGFDPDRSVCCTVEGALTLVHGPGGRGYGLGATPISSGCHQWKFLIVKENKGNEGTCIGVARYPIKDYSHRTTSDMWLYRAYSGNLYHNGELPLSLLSFTQGDYITVVLDMDAHTLSFGKNGDEPRLAFEDMDAQELYPCVMFYSNNPGEKVKITDMQVRQSPRDLLPGDPQCAPLAAVLAEAHISLVRRLHSCDAWTKPVNECIMERLYIAKELLPLARADSLESMGEVTLDATAEKSDETEEKEVPAEKKTDEEHTSTTASPSEDPDSSTLDNAQKESREETRTMERPVKGSDLVRLYSEVWPALGVIGGVDRGLRVGGTCLHRQTGRSGVVLGTLKQGLNSVKVQWDDADASVSDAPLSTLRPGEPTPFECSRLRGLTAEILQHILRMSGLTDELPFPDPETKPKPASSLQSIPSITSNKVSEVKISGGGVISKASVASVAASVVDSVTESIASATSLSAHSSPLRTVESLTNAMVSNIMDEVTRRGSLENSQQSQLVQTPRQVQSGMVSSSTSVEPAELLSHESECVQLTLLRLSAMKTLSALLASGHLCDLLTSGEDCDDTFLEGDEDEEKRDDGDESKGEKSAVNKEDRKSLRETVRLAMRLAVSASVGGCGLRHLATTGDLERACQVLSQAHWRHLAEERAGCRDAPPPRPPPHHLATQTHVGAQQNSQKSEQQRNEAPTDRAHTRTTATSSSQSISHLTRCSRNSLRLSLMSHSHTSTGESTVSSSSSGTIQQSPSRSCPFVTMARVQDTSPVPPLIPPRAFQRQSQQQQSQQQTDVSLPQLAYPSTPPVYAPLLEMGFSVQHIRKALNVLGEFCSLLEADEFFENQLFKIRGQSGK